MSYKKCPPRSSMSVEDGDQFLRLKQIIGPNGFIPISRSKFYADIKKGLYPVATKLGRVSVWRKSDILAFIEKMEGK